MLLIVLVFCVAFFLFGLRSMSCVPNVASVFLGCLSLIVPSDFSSVYF